MVAPCTGNRNGQGSPQLKLNKTLDEPVSNPTWSFKCEGGGVKCWQLREEGKEKCISQSSPAQSKYVLKIKYRHDLYILIETWICRQAQNKNKNKTKKKPEKKSTKNYNTDFNGKYPLVPGVFKIESVLFLTYLAWVPIKQLFLALC